jgi:uroporphyrinogen decarboxylase
MKGDVVNIGKEDGIHGMLPDDQMPEHVRKFRTVYNRTPNAPIYHFEGWYYSTAAWKEQGLPADLIEYSDEWNRYFSFDPEARVQHFNAGWCEAPFYPAFDEKVLEKRPDGTEVIQDTAGRKVLMFQDVRSGFMPEYLDHPVKDMKSWQENVKWRLEFKTSERQAVLAAAMPGLVTKAKQGYFMTQRFIGAYMFLRSLMGPEDLLYMFYDDPGLIHDCLQTWCELTDQIVAHTQQHISLDELFIGEDICYNNGPLISPEMIEEFLMPYYRIIVGNARKRQMDQQRKLHVQLDTDGKAMPVIDLYAKHIGMDVMSPFEAASGCDVVQIGKDYPDLIMIHGIDKRILAKSKDAIDAELERIIPAMKARGGYIPACDHGVPAEVSLENYLHYRKRMVELGG